MVWDARNPLVSFIGLLLLMWFGPLFSGCDHQSGEDDHSSDLKHFFENSTRRDPSADEANAIVRLKGCTGFFVANDQDRLFVMTARHCFGRPYEEAPQRWCDSDLGTVTDANSGAVGKCHRVVAATEKYDLTLLEFKFAEDFRPAATLRLASFVPALETQLHMVGYPADKFRESKLTLTENCWIVDKSANSPHQDLVDLSGRHNCTTYGGNSGGPMIKVGTDIAVGEPFTYRPRNYKEYEADKVEDSAFIALMAGFVERHGKELSAAGVVIAHED